MTIKQIENDLFEQLHMKGMDQAYYLDMVKDYSFLFKTKKNLQKDIKENGVRIEVTTGNGFVTSRTNESIKLLNQCNSQMLKILKDLGLDTPVMDDVTEDDYM